MSIGQNILCLYFLSLDQEKNHCSVFLALASDSRGGSRISEGGCASRDTYIEVCLSTFPDRHWRALAKSLFEVLTHSLEKRKVTIG